MLAVGLGSSDPLAAQDRFGFSGLLGWESVSGDASEVLDQGITGEFNVYYQFGGLRAGGGASFVSYDVVAENVPPSVLELAQRVSRVTLNLLVGYKFNHLGTLRPYVEGRVGYIRLRPEWNYWDAPGEPGENTQDRLKGVQYGARGGLEIAILRKWSLDLSAIWTGFSVDEFDGEPIGLENFDSGTTLGFLAGISFYP